MAPRTGRSDRGFRSPGNARLSVAFVVLWAGELPGRGRFLAWSPRSDSDTTETEASRWSRASPEVDRGRSRGADRWRAAWLAFPAGSGSTGSTGEWGRAVQGWDRLRELTGGPAFAPAQSWTSVVVSAPGNRVAFGTHASLLSSQALHQYADRTSSVVSSPPRTFHSFLAYILRVFIFPSLFVV